MTEDGLYRYQLKNSSLLAMCFPKIRSISRTMISGSREIKMGKDECSYHYFTGHNLGASY